MLQVIVHSSEHYDEANNEFIEIKEQTLQLEHSLISISKWESIWNTSFLNHDNFTNEEFISYVKCMNISKAVDDKVYRSLNSKNIKQIRDYMNASMTATWFSNEGPDNVKKGKNREIITSEIIYYLMITYQIPFECQKWHINRLLTLIKVCSVKSQDSKKMGKRETMKKNAALNSARRSKYNTKG